MTESPHPPPPLPPPPLYVVCDRCRAEGETGEDPFAAFGDLLDFEPVPRRANRADGWTAEVQRAFIAALSLTGSDRQAARAVGKAQFGVKQLLDNPDSAGFRAAREEAHELAAQERSRRLAEGVRAVAAEQAGWRPLQPPWAGAASRRGPGRPPARAEPPLPLELQETPEGDKALVEMLLRKYWLKLRQERVARLAGRIVEADWTLRQLTWLEVAIDLGHAEGGFAAFEKLRAGEYDVIDVAETPFSRVLGALHRRTWAEAGEPRRPEHPPAARLRHHQGFSTEPLEATYGGRPESHEEQRAAFAAEHARAAEAQIQWEAEARREALERRASEERRERDASSRAKSRAEPDGTEARRDHERRRDSDAANDQEPGEAGQPAPQGDRTDGAGPPPRRDADPDENPQ